MNLSSGPIEFPVTIMEIFSGEIHKNIKSKKELPKTYFVVLPAYIAKKKIQKNRSKSNQTIS